MRLRFEQTDLRLRHRFTIARGSRDTVPVVIVMIEKDQIVGFGEASPSTRYGETPASVIAFLSDLHLDRFDAPFEFEDIGKFIQKLPGGSFAAKAAVDIALHDWLGKSKGAPLWRCWGLDKKRIPETSMTIGIDSPEIIAQKVNEASEFGVLKVKLGGKDDEEIIRTIRQVTGKKIRVDANEAWTVKEQALEKINWLESEGVELVEQPMPAHLSKEIAWVRERVHIPLLADESVRLSSDIVALKDAFDGINIKLMKCGGLAEARKMIDGAKRLAMKVMLGCMVESSVGISAAAQLGPLADYADLDGNLLVTNDPFTGVHLSSGRLVLTDLPGIGAAANN